MTELEAMRARHSVRQYQDRPLEAAQATALRQEIEACNALSGLHIQLVTDEPKAFGGLMAHYGKFSGVRSYIALVGKKGPGLDEACGYWGEKLVLAAQMLGLNTCWVALTYKKVTGAFQVAPGEKLALVIALGHGATQGVPHKSKPAQAVSDLAPDSPDWYRAGVEAALLAPTAMNQQKFTIARGGETATIKAGRGAYAKVDLGIVKYHFELGSGRKVQ
ncbi:MAG: nitroreductase family protein [Candidatus Spyradocola sp.]